MNEMMKTMAASASGMAAQAARIRLGSENIANVDTPGYHRKTVSFEQTFGQSFGQPFSDDSRAVVTGPVRLDQNELARTYDPTNPLAGKDGYTEGSNVDLLVEIADAREANRSYEANLKMFDQARQMASSLLDLIRR
ncbi:flagellar basal-body rod protein FlgC [Amaricoccus macauensis]|uniref:Flagellar basal body rod protein FlgB n=1 Tax=Amaricoccus macauensis TaxID=57001 RepID=A0A840SR08_9RHOB|nr:flagellar basal body rod protein FlgC [Amaricoccus macauensis]MBB5222928.1 flagellar basal-body rod protein FlgC [Amaricoccus macauensis]